MLYPTIDQLTKDEFNRYELALATAKCARILTDEYVTKKETIEKTSTGNKEHDRNAMNALNKEYREAKAVKNAITKIHNGEFTIVRLENNGQDAEAEAETVTEQPKEETAEE